jgi:predicted secreted protein
MSDQASIGHGILFKRKNPTSGLFETIGGLVQPQEPVLDRDMLDATDTESPARYKEYLAGLRNAEAFDLEFERRRADPQQQLLYDDYNVDVPRTYQLVAPDAAQTTWEFDGYVKTIKPSNPLDGKEVIAVTFQPTGKPNKS